MLLRHTKYVWNKNILTLTVSDGTQLSLQSG